MFQNYITFHNEMKVSAKDAIKEYGLEASIEEITNINREMSEEIALAVSNIKDSYKDRLESAITSYQASLRLVAGRANG